jgi:ribosomal protein S18 acetylase RimI-like enzyme
MHVSELHYKAQSDSEIESLLSLFIHSYSEEDFMASREIVDIPALRKILTHADLIHFIAYEEKVPVGYCQVIHKAHSINFNSGAKINALSVLPSKRGQGIGTLLLTEAIRTLQNTPKVQNIYLDVAKSNMTAIKLYKKLGFLKVGELKNLFTKNDILIDIETYSLNK